jgi:hypothetical protein
MSYRADKYMEALTVARYIRDGVKKDISDCARDLLYTKVADISAIARRLDMLNGLVAEAEQNVEYQESLLSEDDRAVLGLAVKEEETTDVDENG